MSKDLTQNLNASLEDKVDRLITIVESIDSWGRSIDSHMENVETRLGSLETGLESLDTRLGSLETRLESFETRLGSLETGLESLDTRLESLETRLESFDARLGSLETRLGSLETKVDERLKDTRPMWEAVQTQLAELRESQDRLRGEMEKGFRLVDRRLESQPVAYDKLFRYHRDLEERVEKIEKQSS